MMPRQQHVANFALVGLVALSLCPPAGAVDYAEEFTRKIQAARAIAPLGSDLFGDSTDWYTCCARHQMSV